MALDGSLSGESFGASELKDDMKGRVDKVPMGLAKASSHKHPLRSLPSYRHCSDDDEDHDNWHLVGTSRVPVCSNHFIAGRYFIQAWEAAEMDADLVCAPNLCMSLPLPSSPSFQHTGWQGQGGLRSRWLTWRLNVFPSQGSEACQGLVPGPAQNQLAVPELHSD